jgi:hypothetical protein
MNQATARHVGRLESGRLGYIVLMTNKEAIMKITGRVQIMAEAAGLQFAANQAKDGSVLFTSLAPGSVKLFESFEGQGAIAIDRADGKPLAPVITRHYNLTDVENASKMIVEALAGVDTAHEHKHEHAK